MSTLEKQWIVSKEKLSNFRDIEMHNNEFYLCAEEIIFRNNKIENEMGNDFNHWDIIELTNRNDVFCSQNKIMKKSQDN